MIWNNKRDSWVVYAFIGSIIAASVAHAVFDHIDLSQDMVVENVRREIENEERKQWEQYQKDPENECHHQNYIREEIDRFNEWLEAYYQESGQKVAWQEKESKTSEG